ncbi:MAG TPA: hypothetical protein VMF52_19965 [Steroidobacteraceae bacterium]|nr:hypothetical protein [Steroidobacteraceae bacterium]
MRHLLVSGLFALSTLTLSACGPRSEDAEPPHQDWVIDTRVEFGKFGDRPETVRPKESLRLWVPYVVGDIYGSPNAGEISPVSLRPDLTFTLNLNLGYLKLDKALVPTEFSQKWMTIEPKEARVARLIPYVLPVDGITPVGTSEWLDLDSGARLLLVYVDRPARIRGEVVYEGRSLRFDIDAKEAGYLWVTQPEQSGEYTAVPRPKNLVLAVL